MVGERVQRRENAVGVSHGTLHLLCRRWHTVDYFPFCIIKMGDGDGVLAKTVLAFYRLRPLFHGLFDV